MTEFDRKRRTTLIALGALATSSGGLGIAGCAQSLPANVPWSTGATRTRIRMPADATDCHHHIYDHGYPWAPEATLKPGSATVDDYRLLQQRIGTSRNVVIQPSSYGIDNRLLLASIARFNGRARGVAVVNTSVTDAQLDELHQGGVRGIRFNLAPPGTTTLDMVKPLAKRVGPMGWHIQVNAPADYLLDAKDIWFDLPCPVVFDHLAHVPEPDPLNHPAFEMVANLLTNGKAYVKLTGFYMDTRVGPPAYADSVKVASAYAAIAPDRVLWGSDWPHPTEQARHRIPDDALLADLLKIVIPDETMRNKVWVDNPATLYQFA
ncbi:2-pyrone-4,6-dicarboxylate hydrolase [Burkholderia sp. Bp9140]|uniref:amidohydrolase family protein n=1 Tax=Burkholderia sp. Bp9140 TaxID=2184572 RepID=UPI000F5788A2|nr:amidohydrolase family protein [Burkholderia sp. Bp9140]RQR54568.1 2-pyrone-4,6-dicarboxylate hydrolase [Burkholderia sp. Bp9140]